LPLWDIIGLTNFNLVSFNFVHKSFMLAFQTLCKKKKLAFKL
jgi:hypothetical protein